MLSHEHNASRDRGNDEHEHDDPQPVAFAAAKFEGRLQHEMSCRGDLLDLDRRMRSALRYRSAELLQIVNAIRVVFTM